MLSQPHLDGFQSAESVDLDKSSLSDNNRELSLDSKSPKKDQNSNSNLDFASEKTLGAGSSTGKQLWKTLKIKNRVLNQFSHLNKDIQKDYYGISNKTKIEKKKKSCKIVKESLLRCFSQDQSS